VDASVSLHELEEQVMPAIDTLEREAARLKREMQQLARSTAFQTHAVRTQEAAGEDGSDEEEGCPYDEDITEVTRTDEESSAGHFLQLDSTDLAPELSLLMGSLPLLSSTAPGIPVTRVLISSGSNAEQSATGDFDTQSSGEESTVVRSVLARLPK
jgi:hypothetical protein